MSEKLDMYISRSNSEVQRFSNDLSYYFSFLKTSSRLYKYNFKDQVLIHSQRPDAVACAEYDLWRSKDIDRYVQRGSKGIALVDEVNGKPALRYVFDFSDTRGRNKQSKGPFLWKISEDNQRIAANALENNGTDLADVLLKKAHELAVQHSSEHIKELMWNKEGSFLEELDELNVQVRYRKLLEASIGYVLLSRCGIDAENYIENDDFSGLYEFNTSETMCELGTAVSDLSEEVLRTIEKSLKNYERNKNYERSNITENNHGERNRVRSGRGNSDISPELGNIGTEEHRKVRTAAADVSQREPQGNVSGDADVRKAEQSFGGNGRSSASEVGADNLTDEGGSGSNRRTERTRPNEMGGNDEQHSVSGGRNNNERADLHLTQYSAERAVSDVDTAYLSGANQQMTLDEIIGAPEEQPKENDRKISAVRVGGFYELFGDDAKIAAEKLGLVLTSGNGEAIVGFPQHVLEQYTQKLKEAGFSLQLWDDFKQYGADKLISENMDKYILPRLAFDEQVAITDEFFNYEAAWHDVSKGISDIAEKYRSGEDVRIELAKEMFKNDVNSSERETFSGINFDIKITHNENGVDLKCENIEKHFSWKEVGDLHWDYLKDTFKTIQHERVEEYPEEKEKVDKLIANIDIANSHNEQELAETDEPHNSAITEPNSDVEEPSVDVPMRKTAYNAQKHDFIISDEHLGEGGAKSKFKANTAAIRLLNQLEDEKRLANPDEQRILSQYTGWGGLPQAFDENNSEWSAEYLELKALLSTDEYESARGSTLNAHYTSPTVINAIYEGLSNLGFEAGNVLEPSMGVGNFFGSMPEEMRSSRLYGVELDSITGRIAKQLYQNADIQVTGFEKTTFPDNFFDVAVGNVPFGAYKLAEKRYDKLNLNIHDHFFAKALDKVRAGGVVAFVTSKGTLDKANPQFRKYLAQRAELLGAIRLPNNAFKANAGTEVTSDIIFLQKRDKILDIEPDWVNLGETADGVPVNKYFEEHPEMVLGEMKKGLEFSLYGNSEETACIPFEDADLKELLKGAVSHIQGEIPEIEAPAQEEAVESIPASPDVKNFSYTVIDDKLYFRENSRMFLQDLPSATEERVKGMVEIRDCVRKLIDYQLNEYSDDAIQSQQAELNKLYDNFTKKYGLLNSTANSRAFSEDDSYHLLTSLEHIDDMGNLKRKSDMFTKRTIKQRAQVTSVDTASEALAVSISEKARVDIPFMAQLAKKSESEIISDLRGVIYRVPTADNEAAVYVTADEYLSGNIRNKLAQAKLAANISDEYEVNVKALEQAMPKPLEASEIDVRLGATWIDTATVKQFMNETFNTPLYIQSNITVSFSRYTSEWQIDGKNSDRNNTKINETFGTPRKNAYSIIEDTLNLRDARVYDRVEDENGNVKSVLNKKETMLAQEKQEAIKSAFKEWIFRDPERREKLVEKYNVLFNSSRPREYDGSHINFVGINPEITLRTHQRNAIAHTMYGSNTLLAHQVGAGKSFEMIASAMESKRLGLCTKSLFVVPNHLTEQMGAEFLRLYPAANILVATKKDFEAKNRKRLCAKIATGDYDAVIIGHSQLEKIPISPERQERMIRNQIEEITDGINSLGKSQGARFSVKQLEKTKKNLEAKLEKLTGSVKRDDVVTFEELGIDKLFVDEAHSFKNLFLYTKMRNVAGIQQTEAQKSADLYMKCQYMDEITGGKGVVFATGTPISNSMTEMYTMMRYLQADKLQEMDMRNFDSWAANYGEAVTAIELAPEGTGYRAKTRFSKFFNLPELMNVFKEAADIKTADMLDLPVPEAHFHNVVVQPTEIQKEMVAALSDRAAAIHNNKVTPDEDNMLKVTNDGRKIGLDQRLINPLLEDSPNSKVNVCIDNVYDIYKKTDERKSTQLIFCDFSTPKSDGTFNLYDDIRNKLIAKGVPKNEIAFIHEADTEVKKKDLYAKMREGKVRIMLGSTSKCGAGMNVQDKLIALHHLDCPWRPSDLEQREGRIIRQGNENKDFGGVDIFRYVTEATFDAYLYQTIENKQRFISQIMTSKSPVRSCEDADETTLSYAEVKALCAGNPLIKEKMDLDIDVAKLKVLKANHTSQQYRLEDKVRKDFPEMISKTEQRIKGYESDIKHLKSLPVVEEGISPMSVNGETFTEKEKAGAALIDACKTADKGQTVKIGNYKGFDMLLHYNPLTYEFCLDLKRELTYSLPLGESEAGNITRIDNAFASIEKLLVSSKEQSETLHQQLEDAKTELGKPFPQEQELADKSARLAQLNAELNMDGSKDEKSVEQTEDSKEEIKKPGAEISKAADANPSKKPSVYGEIAKIKEEQQAKAAPEEEKTLDKNKDSSIE